MNQDSDLLRCPFCQGKLSSNWRSKILVSIDAKQDAIKKLTVAIKKVDQEYQDATERKIVLNKKIDKLDSALRAVDIELQSLLTTSDESSNPYSKQKKSLLAELLESKARVKRLKGRRAEVALEKDRWAYWVRGFRDLRLWVLDATLAELEMRVNNSLAQLGLPRWSIHMAVERENKSGGVSKGFTVDVKTPESVEGSPWKGWGGGVSQRMRMAAEIGLGHLIADRGGHDIGIEFWDEPESHLSEQGVQDLLIHLHARSQDEKRQIWVVTHRAVQYPFDGKMLVRRTINGSEVIVY